MLECSNLDYDEGKLQSWSKLILEDLAKNQSRILTPKITEIWITIHSFSSLLGRNLLSAWLLLLNAEHAEHERLTNERCRMVGGTISMRVLNTHTHTTCINAYKHALTYHSWRMLAAFLTQTQHRSKTSANTVFFSVMSVVTRLSLCARLI